MLDILRSALWFAVVVGVLVAFHEFGHFWVARRLGVKVLRYSIGFGKILYSRRGADGCEYSLSAVPLGGYVKMLDEREGEVAPQDLPRAFNRQSPARRFAIVAAGPLANFLLAVVLFWLVYVIGQPGLKPVVAQPPEGSAAARAGVLLGEIVRSVDGEPVATWNGLRTLLLEKVIDRGTVQLQLQHSLDDASTRALSLPLDAVRMDPEFLFGDLGLSPFQPKIEPVISGIEPGGAAEQSGFKAGDRLLSRDGVKIESWQDWAMWVRAHPGAVPEVRVQRAGTELVFKPLLATIEQGDQRIGRFGARVEISRDASSGLMAEDRLSPLAAVPAAFRETWRMSALTLRMFGRMFTGDVSMKNVSGPLQIAEAAGFSASIGAAAFLSFMALVSVSLGVLNLLPVPVLDGGHLVFYGIEMVRGAPLSERTMALGQRLGLTFLALLMGLAFYNDLSRLIG